MKLLSPFILLLLLLTPEMVLSKDTAPSLSLNDIYEKLNLASFRNSTGPRRTKDQKYFSHLGFPLSKIDGDTLLVETEDWSYRIKLLQVKDINRDGKIDAIICFTDKAKVGSYNAQQPILITQYEPSGDIVAIKFEVDGCESYAK